MSTVTPRCWTTATSARPIEIQRRFVGPRTGRCPRCRRRCSRELADNASPAESRPRRRSRRAAIAGSRLYGHPTPGPEDRPYLELLGHAALVAADGNREGLGLDFSTAVTGGCLSSGRDPAYSRYVPNEATITCASTVTSSMPTRDRRTHASITIPLSSTRANTSSRPAAFETP